MNEYHKIQSVFKREPTTKHRNLIFGDYSLPEFEYLKDNIWTFTEKIDGTNIRVMYDGKHITFGGKTDNADIPIPLLGKLKERFWLSANEAIFARKFVNEDLTPVSVCLYGEGYGAKIQSGGNYRIDQDFILFDVNINGWWLQRKDIEDIANALSIDVVPIIGEGTLTDMVNVTREGFNSRWGNFLAEGIVARPKTELKTRGGERIITKVKYKDFKGM